MTGAVVLADARDALAVKANHAAGGLMQPNIEALAAEQRKGVVKERVKIREPHAAPDRPQS